MVSVVRVGDYPKGTIYSISRATGYKVSDIITANPSIDIRNLTADTMIKLPVSTNFSAVNIDDYGSIYSISQKTGISVDDIIAANPGININSIPAGTTINVTKEVLSTVNIDDYGSIYSISQKTGVSVDDIIAANPGININSIPAGTTINVTKEVLSTVNIDDYGSIYSISQKTGISVDDIVAANPGIDINDISSGTKINVPKKSISPSNPVIPTEPVSPTPEQQVYEETVEDKNDTEVGNEPCEKCKEFIIVIDPGHGGSKKIGVSSANNAKAVSGILEKTLTLSLGRKIKTILNNKKVGKYKIKVLLTRSTDVNKSLYYRRTLPNTKKAKLNLSLHFNGNDKESVHGVEIFSGSSASKHRTFSKIILKYAHAEINKQYKTRSRGVKDGSHFGAIRKVSCPSALLEGEFITNKKASAYFSNDTNMQKFALAISDGLVNAMSKIYNIK